MKDDDALRERSRHGVTVLFLLMALLETGRTWTLRELAGLVYAGRDGSTLSEREVKTFRERLQDDLRSLRRLGVDVHVTEDDGQETTYRGRRSGRQLPTITLDDAEVGALAVAVGSLEGRGEAGGVELVARSLARAGTGRRHPFDEPPHATAYRDLSSADVAAFALGVDESLVVQLTHQAGELELDPWGLVRSWGRTYLVGHDRVRREVAVVRGRDVTAGSVRVLPRPPREFTAMPADHTLSDYVYTRVGGRTALVRVLGPSVARFRGEAGRDAVVAGEPDDDGACTFQLRFFSVEHAAAVLRQYGDDVSVESPEDLRGAVETGLAAVAGLVAQLEAEL